MSCEMAKGSFSFNRDCAIQDLTRGYELAKKLQSQLEPPGRHGDGDGDGDGWLELATGLSSGVLQTFTAALSLIKSNRNMPKKAKKVVKHSGPGNRNQRVPKRRREMNSWTEVTPAPYLDGYQWRKYGQKKIHNVKYQRSYYRCTHSSAQGCPATKQVQQQDQYGDSAPMFLVIYNNQHTCTTTKLPPPQIILDSQAEQKSSFWILESEKPHPKFTNAAVEEKLPPVLATQKVSGEEMLSPQRDVCAPPTDHTTTLDLTALGTTRIAQEVPTASTSTSLPDMDGCLMNAFHFLNWDGCEFDELSNLLNSIV